ncbi:MAG: radical SAM family heme chaperone HemW [Desulfofustis sp.]|nr:radical SAM family heme chaperone HemW [Desulfofustis sp.]
MNCLYLHIPFCRKKCSYCSFNSYADFDSLHPRYRRALSTEISTGPELEGPLETIFVGGGTPTVLNFEDLAALLGACREKYGFDADAEVSIEANPESVDYQILSVLRGEGFNRLSIGIQSLHDNELNTVGRIHDGAMAKKAVIEAGRAGFKNLSIDLMYGLPGQSAKSWHETLQGALELGPRHLSAYQLSIEEDTPFHRMVEEGDLLMPAEDLVVEMDKITRKLSAHAGLQQYEISNFSQPGYECRHNLNYWRNGEYMGYGAGAVSFVGGVRDKRVADPLDYCQAVEQGGELIVEKEALSTIDSYKETVVMGLRLNSGISESRLERRYGLDLREVYGASLDDLVDRGLILYDGVHLVLTETGRRFTNQVMAELV